MRTLIVIGALSVLVIGGLMAVILFDEEEVVEPVAPPPVVDDEPEPKPPPLRRYPPQRFDNDRMPDENREKKLNAGSGVDENNVIEFGKEFHDKWYEDRERLGRERHKELEKLWFDGRRPRGDPDSIDKLEKLLEEFPDTNRAGCAAFELGHHYMRSRALSLEERRKKAEEYWHMAENRYRESLCEYNSHPAAMSKLALATWVYRKSNPGRARRLLEEIIEKHKGETDHLGQPLEVAARRFLERLK